MRYILGLLVLLGALAAGTYWFYPEEIEPLFGGTLSSNVAVDTTVETANTSTEIPGQGIVWTSDTNGYIFYEDSGGGLSMSSTTNSGATWSAARNVDSVNTTDVVTYSVWWDGWTPGTTTTRYIHIMTLDLGVDDTYYTRLDTQTGSFSTTVLGTTQGAACTEGSACYGSITMTATGTLYMMGIQASDSWVVSCFQFLGCSTAANWSERTSSGLPTQNVWGTLSPIPGTDNIMWVAAGLTGNQLVYRIYSATSSSWFGSASSSVSNTIDQNTTYDAQQIGMSHSTTTGLIYLTATDDNNEYALATDHDVKVWTFSTTTWSWTARTDCTTDYTGGVVGAKIAYDETNDTLYCIMGLRTNIAISVTGGIYYKTSTNNGTTWSATSSMVNDNADDINGLTVNIIGLERIGVTWNYTTAPRGDQQYYDDIADLTVSLPSVTLNSPADASSDSDTTPTLTFTGTDGDSSDIRYNVQIDTSSSFLSTVATPILMATSSGSGVNEATTAATSTTEANFLVLGVAVDTTGTPTVSDNKSNTWTQLTSYTSTNARVRLYYVANPNVGTGHTVTVTLTGAAPSIHLAAFRGVATSSPFDQQNGANTAAATTLATGSITPSQNNSLLFSALAFDQTGTPISIDNSFVELHELNFSGGVNYGSGVAYLMQTSAGAINPTWTRTNSNQMAATIASFKPLPAPILDVLSGRDAGFSGTPDSTDPFTSGQAVTYTVQSALSPGTYYWRVRGIDPNGDNQYGAWSATRSFEITGGGYSQAAYPNFGDYQIIE